MVHQRPRHPLRMEAAIYYRRRFIHPHRTNLRHQLNMIWMTLIWITTIQIKKMILLAKTKDSVHLRTNTKTCMNCPPKKVIQGREHGGSGRVRVVQLYCVPCQCFRYCVAQLHCCLPKHKRNEMQMVKLSTILHFVRKSQISTVAPLDSPGVC